MFRKYYYLVFLIIILTGFILFRKGKILGLLLNKTPVITLSADKISKIEILYQEKKTVLEKKGQKWTISSYQDFPANNEEIKNFLSKIQEIKNPTVISIKPSKYDIYEVSDAKGVKVAFYDAKSKLPEIIFGKTDPSFAGSYFRLKGRKEVFLGQEDLRTFLTDFDFRDLTIIKTNIDKLKKLEFKTEGNEFTLEKKETKDKKYVWFINNEEVDQEKVTNYLSTVAILTAKDVFFDKKEETGLTSPKLTLIFSEDGQSTKVIKVGNSVEQGEDTGYFLSLNNSPIIYFVSSSLFNDLLKTEADFQST